MCCHKPACHSPPSLPTYLKMPTDCAYVSGADPSPLSTSSTGTLPNGNLPSERESWPFVSQINETSITLKDR